MPEDSKETTLILDAETDAALYQMLLEEFSASECPSLETLTDYASAALEATQQEAIAQHIQTCPACASNAVDLWTLFAEVRAMHTGWQGWRGAWLAGKGALAKADREAWNQHCERCARCRKRTGFALWLMHGGWLRSTLTFAGGAGVTACLFLLMARRPETPPAPIEPPGVGVTQTPKNGSGSGGWLDAPEMLKKFVFPEAKQRPQIIEHWEECAAENPNDPVCWAALQRLYRQQAAQETDPSRKKSLLAKAQEATRRANETLAKSTTSVGGAQQ
jgi:hypothetical protein